MALRLGPSAGHGRAALRRAGPDGLAVALYAAAGAAVTWPALRDADGRFLALAEPGHGEAAPGDHLQVSYQLWLVGHRLARGDAPWVDPYSFQPAADGLAVFQGWLFGLPLWPLFAAFGPVAAWNVFVLTSYVLGGMLAAAWLRSLGLSRPAALAGGLVFAVFPYRVAQSTGHLLGPISMLLPLALWSLERRRFALAGAALIAMPLSGQLHLALGAIPLVVAYGAVRERLRAAAAAAVVAVGTGIAVQQIAVAGSIADEGRTLKAVAFFTPDWQDFVARELRHEPPIGVEFVVFMGWLTPLLAVSGLVVLVRARRYALAGLLGGAVAVPVWLALGTKVPTYELLWEHVAPFRYPRAPERLMPIAGLAVAALVAYALARWARPVVVAVALVVLFLDLRVPVYGAAAADPENEAYAALGRMAPGRVLELPVFAPGRHFASVYLYYATQAPRERVAGYSTTAPPEAAAAVHALQPLQCGRWTPERERLLRRLDVRYVVVHGGLYRDNPLVRAGCQARAEGALVSRGWRPVARDGPVSLFTTPAAEMTSR